MSGFKLSDPSKPDGVRPPEPADRPLDLAVHAMPEVALLADQAASRAGGRLRMFLILLICAAPVVASYLAYYLVRPQTSRHFGQLIEPQRPLPGASAIRPDGSPLDLRSLKGQWLLLSVAAGGCDERCQRNLYLQRQLRESLGKDKGRLDWVWLISDQAEPPAALRPALSMATVLRLPADQLAGWLVPAPGRAIEDHLYLVDPMGHLMMRFPANLDVEGAGRAKRDLERLLRASASWDQPGR